MSSWRETPSVAETATEEVFSILPGIDMSLYLRVGGVCQLDRITTVQDTITLLYRCVVEIQMKAELEQGGQN